MHDQAHHRPAAWQRENRRRVEIAVGQVGKAMCLIAIEVREQFIYGPRDI